MPDAALLRVSVIGAGSWGTALAALACRQSDTVLWGRNPEHIRHIQQTGQNPAYLPGITLPQALRATDNLPGAVSHALANGPENGLLILGVPVAGMASTCRQLADALEGLATDGLAVIWTCKGFEPDTADLPHAIVDTGLGSISGLVTGVLSGPSFAREVAQGLPVALTIAGSHPSVAARTVAALHSQQARIYTSEDIIGVEVGGALKNVMAIACGIADGLELGTNARAALITRGLAEMQRLGMALGGRAETFAGLTGLGDLVLTATGPLSRNRQVGLLLGQGQSLQSILSGGITAEGVRCARAVRRLGQLHHIDMPITEAVCEVLFEGVSPPQAVARLLARDARPE